MKVVVNTEDLKNSISTLVKIGGKEIGGLEENILIESVDENIYLKSAGNDIGLEYKIKSNNTKNGKIIVPGQAIEGVVESLVNNNTAIEKDANRVVISTETSTSKVNTLPESENKIDFPEIEDSKSSVVIEKEILTNGFRTVSHAAAVGVVKPELSSVSMYTKDNTIYFVATDTFRLSEVRFDIDINSDFSTLIPIKNVSKILRVLDGSIDSKIKVDITNDGIFFSTTGSDSGFRLYTRSIDAVFPDYKGIINQNIVKEVVVLKTDVMNFFKKAKFFSNTLNKINMSFDGNDVMILSFENESVGSTEDKIPVVDVVGDTDIPSFNYKFLMDAIASVRDDRVQLKFAGSVNPVLIRGVKDQSFTAIVSPLIV